MFAKKSEILGVETVLSLFLIDLRFTFLDFNMLKIKFVTPILLACFFYLNKSQLFSQNATRPNVIVLDNENHVPYTVTSFKKNNESKKYIEDNKIEVKYETKNWYYVSIPTNLYESLINSTTKKLIYRENGIPEILSDTSKLTHHVYEVQNGTNGLPTPYTGNNVVIGVIDTGVDYKHPDFLDANGHTRVYRYWDQTKKTQTPSSPKPYNYGELWTNNDMDKGIATTKDDVGHGTNVTGIAAGNGKANGHNKGMAPDATIIMVESNLSAKNWTLTVADACDYIFKVADSLGLPCVINISAGTQFGSHDGTDPASEKMETLLDEKTGRIIVAAAGNSGDSGPYHVHGIVDTDTSFYWVKSAANGIAGANSIYVDTWADSIDFANVKVSVGANLPNGNYSFRGRTPFRTWQEISLKDPNSYRDTLFSLSGKKLAYVDYYPTTINHVIRLELVLTSIDSINYNYQFTTTGKGSYDAWSGSLNKSGSKTYNDFVTSIPSIQTLPAIQYYHLADTLQSLYSSFISSEKVITVGNINNRKSYKDKNGSIFTSPYRKGELGMSSSKGPNRKGVLKPDIVASGNYTFAPAPLYYLSNSANNAKIDALGKHAVNGGTSMASPLVAGIAALYLEKCSKASYNDFKNDLLKAAQVNQFTGSLPNYAYGNGVVNALATLLLTNNSFSIIGDTAITCNKPANFTITGSQPISSISWNDGTQTTTKITSTPGTYFFTTKDQRNCISSDTLHLKPNLTLPVIEIINNSNSQTISCKTPTISLSAKGATNYLWSKGNSKNNSSNIVSDGGIIVVSGTDSNGCIGKDSIYIMLDTIKPNVAIDVFGSHSISCAGTPVFLKSSGALTYLWDGGNSINTDTNSIYQAGKYTVTGSNSNGCSDTAAILITKHDFPPTPTIIQKDSVLTSSIANNYSWYINGIHQKQDTLQSLKITENGQFMVSVNVNGCISSSVYYNSNLLIQNQILESIQVYPNPITASRFKIDGIEINSEIHLYDILGNELSYKTTQLNEYEVENLTTGVYILTIKQRNNLQTIKLIKN